MHPGSDFFPTDFDSLSTVVCDAPSTPQRVNIKGSSRSLFSPDLYFCTGFDALTSVAGALRGLVSALAISSYKLSGQAGTRNNAKNSSNGTPGETKANFHCVRYPPLLAPQWRPPHPFLHLLTRSKEVFLFYTIFYTIRVKQFF